MRYIDFIVKEQQNKKYLWIALCGIVLQFVIFKLLYPYPDFFSDSYSYIFAAASHLNINIWPIGYSKFLALVHWFTHSDTVLVGFQYFFLELSALYFFFTVLYFFKPSRTSITVLFVFLFFNPLFLYIGNYVNSDPLFAALSLLWITQLIWIIYRPRLYQVFAQAIVLFACFTVRNNAYYYPIITALAFVLSRQELWRKWVGALLGMALIIPFILFEQDAALKLTGTRQFSLFTGWQLANNALYMRGNIEVDNTELPSAALQELDSIAKRFYLRVPPDFNTTLADYTANFFLLQPESPLRRYFAHHYGTKDEIAIIIGWAKASTVYEDYGTYLIKHHPMAFARYFLLVNSKNYFLPPLEKLKVYNMSLGEVSREAQQWFDYRSPKVESISPTAQGLILFLYPAFFFLVNIYCIGGGLWLLISKKFRYADKTSNKVFLLIGFLYIINAGFSIIATMNVFRYQFFPMLVCFSFSLLLLELLGNQQAFSKQPIDKVNYAI